MPDQLRSIIAPFTTPSRDDDSVSFRAIAELQPRARPENPIFSAVDSLLYLS